MHDNIYISTSAFKTRDFEQILNLCRRDNIWNIELGSNLEYSERILPLLREYNSSQMKFLIHHYFPPHKEEFVLNLASDDSSVVTRSLQHCRFAIGLAAELNCKFYSVHAGYAFDAKPKDMGRPVKNPKIIPYKKAYDTFFKNIVLLNEYAKKNHIKLLIENHEVSPYNLINGKNILLLMPTAKDLLKFYKEVNSDNVGFLIDLGHLKVASATLKFNPGEFLLDITPYIKIFHLNDNNGFKDSHCKFNEKVWFKDIISKFNTIFVIETHNLSIAEIKKCQLNLLKML